MAQRIVDMIPSAARTLSIAILAFIAFTQLRAQRQDPAGIIHDLDAANQERFDNLIVFTDIEHYAVFRGKDQVHPAAEMTVKMTYRKGVGKSYVFLSESGSEILLNYGLHPLIEHEKSINDPANIAQSWLTSANFDIKVKSGGTQMVDGRQCIALDITPRRKATNMVDGTLWIDATDHTIVKVEGTASKKPFVFAGTTKMMRQYVNMHGYAMATHARAEASSFLFGRTVVTIDYSDYQFQLRQTK